MRQWPFVGREAELAAVAATLDRGAGALLVGEPGVGKTRLAVEALDRSRAAGYATEWVAATAATAAIPLGAVTHLVPSVDAAEQQPEALFHRVVASLGDTTAGRSVVVGVDDANLLDDTSAAVLHHLATTGRAMLVATARTGQRLPEPIGALRKDGYLARSEVAVLDQASVAEILEAALGGQVAVTTTHRLAATSAGNALYLRELVTSGLEAGTLAPRGGVWRWDGELATGRLGELLEERLADIIPEARDALDGLAFGEPLETRLLHALAPGVDLTDLERRGFVAVAVGTEADERVRLAHPLYADVLRGLVPELRARRIQGRLADVLEAGGSLHDRDVLRLATWRIASGGKADPTLLVAAGYQAKEAGDYRLAERLSRTAVEASGSDEARLLLAQALSNQGRVDEAEHLFAELEATADADERADLAVITALEQFWFGGRRTDAEQTLRRAADLVEQGTSRPRALGVAAAQAGFLLVTGSTTATLNTARGILDAPDAEEITVLQVVIPAATAAAMAGREQEALDLIERGLPLAPRYAAEQPIGTDLLLATRSLVHRLSGRLDEALAQAVRGHEASVEIGSPGLAHPFWLLALGQAGIARGAIDDAARWLREAAMWFRSFGDNLWLPWSLAHLAQALGLAGDASEASARLAEAEKSHDPAFRAFDCDFNMARGWVQAAQGDLSRAASYCLAAADAAQELDQHALAVIALGDAGRLGAAGEVDGRLATLSPQVEGKLAPALAAYVAALATDDTAGVERAAEAFEAMSACLHAAEAWTEAGRIHRAQGSRGRARTAMARARAMGARCPGAHTPTLTRLHDEPALTRREREVAGLVGRGLPNRDIAERLHVSVRTVENHLHRIYAKLGVTGREELSGLVAQLSSSDDPMA